jgi:hypothetical protein
MSPLATNSSPKDGAGSGGADTARDEVPFDLAAADAETLRSWLRLQLHPNVKNRLKEAMKLLTDDELYDIIELHEQDPGNATRYYRR